MLAYCVYVLKMAHIDGLMSLLVASHCASFIVNLLLCYAVFKNTYFSFFFRFQKNMTLRFFEMTYQKVVKSHQKEFSPQYVIKE